jgi:uncharacterized protein with ParB-like and HNH nuclease domain
MKNLLETKTTSFQNLLGNGKNYKIPDFQRDYSWTEENWEDLWNDFLFLEDNDVPHYMGTIVLQTEDNNEKVIVVDGQQRITTMTIVVAAIMKILKDFEEKGIQPEKNKERFEKIRRDFIGEKTLSELHYKSKLTLNQNNNTFFQTKILKLEKPLNFQKLRDSERLLYQAFEFFYEKLKEKFKEDDGKKISSFLENIIAKRLIFIEIAVDDELSAYTVFETLNARGVELTTTDLLKNYLFSIAVKESSDSEMEILKEKWKNIIDTVGLKSFPVFLRYYLNSKQKLVRKENLFKNLKNTVSSAKDVFELLDRLQEKADLYNAIKNPYDEFWNENKNKDEIKKSLEELKIFGVSQPIPLFFAVYDKLPGIFPRVLKISAVISFRYNVIARRNPNEMERVYNSVSQKIFNEDIYSLKEIIKELKFLYIDDNDFKNIFSTKEISTGGKNKRLVKYILTEIENHISSSDNDFNDANFTIEHVLPENYSEEWNDLFEGNADKFVHRLGNYTLLEDKKNRRAADKSYQEKKEIYKESRYKLTKEYINFDEWNISSLNSYQNRLAKIATGIWKI